VSMKKYILLALLLAGSPASASYLMNTSGEYLEGTFNSTYVVDGSNSITISAWVKVTNWSGSQRGIVNFEEVSGTEDPSVRIWSNNTDRVSASSYDAGALSSANYDFSVDEYDGEWVLVVGVFTSATLRDIYIETSANTATNTVSRTLDAGDVVRIGNHNQTNAPLQGYIAEVCMWDMALSTDDVDDMQTGFETGPSCSTFETGNLIGYWPLDEDGGAGIENAGTDSGGDLTENGTVTYETDHPTITGGGASTAAQRRRHDE